MSFSNAQKNMESRIEGFNRKEKTYKELKERALARIDTARGKIRKMHEIRAEKQDQLDRNEYKIRQMEDRLKTLEYRIDATRHNVTVQSNANEEISKAQQRLKSVFQKQSELNATLIRNMRRRDTMQKQIQSFQEKEAKYRERMKTLLERMKYHMDRRTECKKNIVEKVNNIKELHGGLMNLEPLLREKYTEMRRAEVNVMELQEKVTCKENEIRHVHKECIYKCDERERKTVELEVKKERKFKGPDAIKHLAR